MNGHLFSVEATEVVVPTSAMTEPSLTENAPTSGWDSPCHDTLGHQKEHVP